MDWVTMLEIAVVLFFGSWFLLILWLCGRELGERALRSRLSNRSESKWWRTDTNPTCRVCGKKPSEHHNPQPPSEPPSSTDTVMEADGPPGKGSL